MLVSERKDWWILRWSFRQLFRASGGPVAAGGAYIVGERGPEILQMGSRGGNFTKQSNWWWWYN